MNDTSSRSPNELLVGPLIDAIPSPVFYKDVDGRYLGCNTAFEVYCGLRREALVGKTAYEIWPKDLADTYHAADLALLKNPGTQIYEAELLYADGTRHQVVFHRTTFLRADGKLGGIAGVAWDITERALAEQALEDQLRFVEQMIEAIPTPAFFKDAGERYLGCNRAFEAFCGLKREDLIGKTVFEIWSPDLAQTYHLADEARLQKPGAQVYEASVRYFDGSMHDVIFHRATFNKADGSLGGIVGVFWDITERKRAEQTLRRSEERFRRMVENAPFGVRVTDANDSIVFVNRRFEEMHHYPRSGWRPWRIGGRTPSPTPSTEPRSRPSAPRTSKHCAPASLYLRRYGRSASPAAMASCGTWRSSSPSRTNSSIPFSTM